MELNAQRRFSGRLDRWLSPGVRHGEEGHRQEIASAARDSLGCSGAAIVRRSEKRGRKPQARIRAAPSARRLPLGSVTKLRSQSEARKRTRARSSSERGGANAAGPIARYQLFPSVVTTTPACWGAFSRRENLSMKFICPHCSANAFQLPNGMPVAECLNCGRASTFDQSLVSNPAARLGTPRPE